MTIIAIDQYSYIIKLQGVYKGTDIKGNSPLSRRIQIITWLRQDQINYKGSDYQKFVLGVDMARLAN